MNLLFICSRNKWRSPTAEKIFSNQSYATKSAGTAASARVKVNENHIRWADLIFAMEKKHKQILNEKFSDLMISKRIIVLDITDNYQFMDEELIELLALSVQPYLDNL